LPRDLNPERFMTSQDQYINTKIPDLTDIPLDCLGELGTSSLAYAIALYRERLKENGIPLSSLNAKI